MCTDLGIDVVGAAEDGGDLVVRELRFAAGDRISTGSGLEGGHTALYPFPDSPQLELLVDPVLPDDRHRLGVELHICSRAIPSSRSRHSPRPTFLYA